jgi:hypothetical protein
MSKDGVVTIHGREYKTVALRVSEFREKYTIDDGWAIYTEIISADDPVIMRATIRKWGEPEYEVASGHAEEFRDSSQINRTSALENCETSAIGRALAAAGFGGSEYASANEVQNAIQQQSSPPAAKENTNPKETETLSPLDPPVFWPDAAHQDFTDTLMAGIKAYGKDGFSERVVRLLTHGDYNATKISEIDFEQDGHRLYDDLTNMLKAHEELKGEEK